VVKADPIPLRKLKNNVNSISDKFDNFLKRNIVGEFSRHSRSRKNRKLHQIKIKQGFSGDYGFSAGDDAKLKIFH